MADDVCQIKLAHMYKMTQSKNIQDLLYFKAIIENDNIKLVTTNKEEIDENIKVMVSILN